VSAETVCGGRRVVIVRPLGERRVRNADRRVCCIAAVGVWLRSLLVGAGWRCCIGSCARRPRTPRTSRARPTSTTARWKCAGQPPTGGPGGGCWDCIGRSPDTGCGPAALACLALLAVLSITGLAWFGFPQSAEDQKASGTVATPTGRQPINLTIRQSDPVRPLAERVEKATEVTLNAVIFRNPDADLTTPGRYFNVTIRILGPVLLGLTILAIRNQVKR
jgi:hypothetical protein